MKKSYEAIFIALLLMVFPLTLAQAENTTPLTAEAEDDITFE